MIKIIYLTIKLKIIILMKINLVVKVKSILNMIKKQNLVKNFGETVVNFSVILKII